LTTSSEAVLSFAGPVKMGAVGAAAGLGDGVGACVGWGEQLRAGTANTPMSKTKDNMNRTVDIIHLLIV